MARDLSSSRAIHYRKSHFGYKKTALAVSVSPEEISSVCNLFQELTPDEDLRFPLYVCIYT